MDIRKKAKGQLNWLEKILHQVPGFKGYYGRELRRDSDRLQRESIVQQLSKVKSSLNKALQDASRKKDFELLRAYDQFAKALDRSIGAIRYADQGYSGFFDLIKIKEAELDAIYELDAKIAEDAERFRDSFKQLADAPLEASIPVLLQEKLEEIDLLFEQRTTLLKGYQEGEK